MSPDQHTNESLVHERNGGDTPLQRQKTDIALAVERAERRHFRLMDPTIRPLWSERRLLILGMILGSVIGLVILSLTWTGIGALTNCHHIQHVYRVIQQQGERGLSTIGKPGGTAFAYYHDHPDELARAKQDLRAEIVSFNPPTCSLPF